jgi:murein endopeptidase
VRQRRLTSILIATAFLGAAASNIAHASTPESPLSFGFPNGGRLIGGRQFHATQFMVMDPAHESSRARWALPALLSVLDRASRIVARKFPGSVLEIGELSRHDGGPISSHRSHQNGRDADVDFYFVDLDDESVRIPRFMRCDDKGGSWDDPTMRFDEKRNWAFVRALLEDPRYEVRQIFIYAPLRARLLAYAASIGAPHAIRAKAAAAMMQPGNALPHDDHFHIRISCPADQVDLGCSDLPLWHAPGSPDEFGPDLLAQSSRNRQSEPVNPFPPEGWAGLSKLWSAERGVCTEGDFTCDEDESPACEDFGSFGLLGLFSPPAGAGPARDRVPSMADDGGLSIGARDGKLKEILPAFEGAPDWRFSEELRLRGWTFAEPESGRWFGMAPFKLELEPDDFAHEGFADCGSLALGRRIARYGQLSVCPISIDDAPAVSIAAYRAMARGSETLKTVPSDSFD